MLIVETIAKIRRAYHRDKKSIRQICREEMNPARNTVRKIIRSDVTELHYERKTQPRPKLEPFKDLLIEALEEDQKKAVGRRTVLLLFEMLPRDKRKLSIWFKYIVLLVP